MEKLQVVKTSVFALLELEEIKNDTFEYKDEFPVLDFLKQRVNFDTRKFDFILIDIEANLYKIDRIGKEGVLCLLSNSTDSEVLESSM
ncbi:hypothetical protein ACIQXZ_29510 [Bacillus thuringiensis]|uniref:hypothetical protein n=1 Tax=Bacillus thuringiensis TaxID=1428 RepID=UPI003827C679